MSAQTAAVQVGGLWRQTKLDSIDLLIASRHRDNMLPSHSARSGGVQPEASQPVFRGSWRDECDPKGHAGKVIASIFSELVGSEWD